jgi:hypothetical protein
MCDIPLQPIFQHLLDSDQTSAFTNLMKASKQSYQIGRELLARVLQPLEHIPIMVTQLVQESDFIYSRDECRPLQLSDLKQFLLTKTEYADFVEITIPIMNHNLFETTYKIQLARNDTDPLGVFYEYNSTHVNIDDVNFLKNNDYLLLLLDLKELYTDFKALNYRFLLI